MNFKIDNIRNIGIFAHNDAGKATISKRMADIATFMLDESDLKIKKNKNVENASDSILGSSAVESCIYEKHKINIVDTPTYIDFIIDVKRAMRVTDGAIFVIDGVKGVERQTETLWKYANERSLSRIVFINKLDDKKADFFASAESMNLRLNAIPVLLQIPVVSEAGLDGIVDLVTMKMWSYSRSSKGLTWAEKVIPESIIDKTTYFRDKLIDNLIEFNVEVSDYYMSGQEIPIKLLMKAIRKSTIASEIVPVFCGSAFRWIGINLLLDGIVNFLPTPSDQYSIDGINPQMPDQFLTRELNSNEAFSGLCFRVNAQKSGKHYSYLRIFSGSLCIGDKVYNSKSKIEENIKQMYSINAGEVISVEKASAGDVVIVEGLRNTYNGDTLCDISAPIILDPMENPVPVVSLVIFPGGEDNHIAILKKISRLKLEDPSIVYRSMVGSDQIIVMGLSELHLSIIVDRLRREFGLEFETGSSEPAYSMTISNFSTGQGAFTGKCGKSNTLCSLKVTVSITPKERGSGIDFVDNSSEPKTKLLINKSFKDYVMELAEFGIESNYPLVDVLISLDKVFLQNAEYDLSAIKKAFEEALKQAMLNAKPFLLEPLMFVQIILPDIYLGDVLIDLSNRRSRIKKIESRGDIREIHVLIPLSEMFDYSNILSKLTDKQGNYSMDLMFYEPVPDELSFVGEFAVK